MAEYIICGLSDFDIAQTFGCGQCFRFDRCEDENGNEYWCGIAGGHYARFTQQDRETVVISHTDDYSLEFWRHFLALDLNYEAVKADIAKHFAGETINEAMKCGYGIRILRQDPWEAICSFIVSQNNNIPRIKKIIAAMSEKFGEPFDTPDGIKYSFPSAEALYNAGTDEIFALRVGFRAPYIFDAAKRVSCGELDIKALGESDYDTLTDALLEVHGIGPKVAACAALYGFGKYAAFPIDVWVKRIMAKYYPEGLDISALGEYAGIAQQYLFYYERTISGIELK